MTYSYPLVHSFSHVPFVLPSFLDSSITANNTAKSWTELLSVQTHSNATLFSVLVIDYIGVQYTVLL